MAGGSNGTNKAGDEPKKSGGNHFVPVITTLAIMGIYAIPIILGFKPVGILIAWMVITGVIFGTIAYSRR